MNIKETLEKIAAWFQPTADKIQSLDWPPEVKAELDKLWPKLPPEIQKKAWELIETFYRKYGPKAAGVLVAALVAKLLQAIKEAVE